MNTVTIKVSASDIGSRKENRDDILSQCMVGVALRRQGFEHALVMIRRFFPDRNSPSVALPALVSRKIEQWCNWRATGRNKPKPFSFRLRVP